MDPKFTHSVFGCIAVADVLTVRRRVIEADEADEEDEEDLRASQGTGTGECKIETDHR
jgi:hypothetical protein